MRTAPASGRFTARSGAIGCDGRLLPAEHGTHDPARSQPRSIAPGPELTAGRGRHRHAPPTCRPSCSTRSTSSGSASTSAGRTRCSPRAILPRPRRFYEQLRERDAADHLAALGRRLPGDLRAAARRRPRHRLDPHRRGPLGNLRERPRGRARPRGGGRARARIEVVDGATGAGGLGCLVIAAAEARARRRLARGGRRRGRRRAQRARHLVLPRHARVPATRRPDRRRPGAARLGAAGSSRSSPSAPRSRRSAGFGPGAGRWSGWRPTWSSCANGARPIGWSNTPSRRPDAELLVERGNEILGFPPLFCTQVGPVLGAHLGSGLLVGGMKRREAV